MSHIKVNYFDSIKNKRTSTTINRNIAHVYCSALHNAEFNAILSRDADAFCTRVIQDYINNLDYCLGKDYIEIALLNEIKSFK